MELRLMGVWDVVWGDKRKVLEVVGLIRRKRERIIEGEERGDVDVVIGFGKVLKRVGRDRENLRGW